LQAGTYAALHNKKRGLKADFLPTDKGTATMNMLVSTIAFGALALAATPALADPVTIVRDGVTYRYTVTEKDGMRIISGRQQGGENFRLVVRKGWVSGQVGMRSVSFRVSDVLPAKTATSVETAAR
jgi:hypothetical protein